VSCKIKREGDNLVEIEELMKEKEDSDEVINSSALAVGKGSSTIFSPGQSRDVGKECVSRHLWAEEYLVGVEKGFLQFTSTFWIKREKGLLPFLFLRKMKVFLHLSISKNPI
jgi:hypothetical protein